MPILKFTGEYIHSIAEDGKIAASFSACCAPMKPAESGGSIASRRAIQTGDYRLSLWDAGEKSLVYDRDGLAGSDLQVFIRILDGQPTEPNLIHVEEKFFEHVSALVAEKPALRVSYEQSHFMRTTVDQPGRLGRD